MILFFSTSDRLESIDVSLRECRERQGDLRTVLDRTRMKLGDQLETVAKHVTAWKLELMQEKGVRHELNKCVSPLVRYAQRVIDVRPVKLAHFECFQWF